MWNRFFALIVTCLLFPASVQAQSAYKIDVEVKGFAADEAFLAYYYGDKQYIKDTVAVSDGKFTFTADEPLDGGIYLVVLPPDNQYFEIIVDKDQTFSLKTDTVDMAGNMVVQGSEDNKIFYADLHFLAEQRKKMEKLSTSMASLEEGSAAKIKVQEEINTINEGVKSHRLAMVDAHPEMLYSKVILAMKEPEIPADVQAEGQEATFYWYRARYLEGLDFQDDRLLRTPVMWNKVKTYLDNLTVKSPDSIISSAVMMIEKTRGNDDLFQFMVVNILNKYAQSKVMGMDAVYVALVEKYYMSGDAFWADEEQVNKMAERALAISPTIIGRKAPNFRMQDTNGDWQSLLGVEGKYTILYFWDYDCGHCKKITPALAAIYPDYIQHDVKFVAVSINGDIEVWKQKVAEYGLTPAINLQDHRRQSGFDGMYDIRSTPRIFILDENKNIVAKQISVDQVRDILDHELGLEPSSTGEKLDLGDEGEGEE
ncbi:MAG: AhpC/TSA family protein [Bacteroidia bacterium]|nr:AhpC/TSA family protein [Bacteroidia bacterium]